jgi:hypothetical protein
MSDLRPVKILGLLLGTYIISYGIARMTIFQTRENYPNGKAGLRQDFIVKKNHSPGQGWEYQIFLPAIKLEETIINYRHNFNRSWK